MKRRFAALIALVLALALPVTAIAVRARTSLTAVESDVMCVVCGDPLALSGSPQAVSERQYIVRLIRQGRTKAEIERELVAQYGPALLGKPPASGFSISLYVLPPVLVLIGVAILVVTLPRWRARRDATATPAADLALAPAEAQRVDEELSRYGG